MPSLQTKCSPPEFDQFLLEVEALVTRLPKGSMSEDENVLTLISKIAPKTWKEIRNERSWRKRCETYDGLKELLREKTRDDFLEKFLFYQVQKRDAYKNYWMDEVGVKKEKKPHHAYNLVENGKGKGRGRGNFQTSSSQN